MQSGHFLEDRAGILIFTFNLETPLPIELCREAIHLQCFRPRIDVSGCSYGVQLCDDLRYLEFP